MSLDNRKSNLDYFRILIMLFIVTVHFLGVGGGFYNVDDGNLNNLTINYNIASLIEAFAIVGVNCFVLLSGYFLSKSTFKVNKLINIICKTLFYSISISVLVIIIFKIDINVLTILRVFLPVTTSSYWFITTYIVLYLISPYLNKVASSITKEEFKNLLIILVVVFSAWKTFIPFAETLDTTKGYGIIWFVVLYFIGAYIRVYFKPRKTTKYYLGVYIGITLFIYLFKISMIVLSTKILIVAKAQNMFYHYNSITVLFSSIALFLAFISWNTKKDSKIITKVSSLTIAVYLIHENFLLRERLWMDIFKANEIYNSNFYFLYLVIDVIIVFIVSVFIEYYCKSIVDWISSKVEKGYNKGYELFRKN